MLSRLFILSREGRRPAHGNHSRWSDEHWRDQVLFYEYFHGDTGAGVGASHQTGWTGVIAFLIHGFTAVEADKVLEKGMAAVTEESAQVAKETDKPEAVAIAKEVHEQVADKVVAQVLEAVQKEVTEAVQDQGGRAEKLQEKVHEIVIEKVVEAVQKKAEEAQQEIEKPAEERRTFSDESPWVPSDRSWTEEKMATRQSKSVAPYTRARRQRAAASAKRVDA